MWGKPRNAATQDSGAVRSEVKALPEVQSVFKASVEDWVKMYLKEDWRCVQISGRMNLVADLLEGAGPQVQSQVL